MLLVTEGSPRTDSSHHWSLIKSHPLIPALVICPVPLGYVTQDCVSNSNCHAFIMPAPYSLVSPGGLYTLAVQNDVSVIWEWMIVNFYQVWYGWVKAYRRHVDWQSVGQFINFAYIDAAIAMSGACKTVWCWIWSLCRAIWLYITSRWLGMCHLPSGPAILLTEERAHTISSCRRQVMIPTETDLALHHPSIII